jgi:hypothetical protein
LFFSSVYDPDGLAMNAKVEFFANGQSIGKGYLSDPGPQHSAPFNFYWTNVPAGDFIITARVTDEQGATADSPPVHITVNGPATNHPPVVNFYEPKDGDAFTAPTNIFLRAYVQDTEDHFDLTVEFFAGTNKIGNGAFVPSLCPAPICPYYTFIWSNVPPGAYALTARASDKSGASTTSPAVNITVLAAPPACNIAETCPCGAAWRNHREYVRCVIQTAWHCFREGLITAVERRELERNAVLSDCGKHAGTVEPVGMHLLPLTAQECQQQGIQFLLSGDYAGQCVVETSGDLSTWTPVDTQTQTINGLEVTCPPTHDTLSHFYRVRLTP